MTVRSCKKLLPMSLFLAVLAMGLSAARAEEEKEGALAPAEPRRNSGLSPPEPLSLKLEASRNRIYLGEAARVTVTLRAAGAPLRNVGYPKLGGSGFGVQSFAMPVEESDDAAGETGASYRFTTTITPRRSGTLAVGPAQLECEQLVPASGAGAFFGATEKSRVLLRSQPLPIEVLPLPEAGRSAGFRGAVGRFTVQRTANPAQVRAGDPVTVRTVVRGSGTLGRSDCESVAGLAIRSYPAVALRRGNSLSCEQVVVPESPLVRELPPATVHFFDPSSGRYRVAKSAAVALRVTASHEAQPAASHPGQPTALPAAAPEDSRFLPPWAWSAAPLCLMAAIAATSFYRRRGGREGSISADAGCRDVLGLPPHPAPSPQGGRGRMPGRFSFRASARAAAGLPVAETTAPHSLPCAAAAPVLFPETEGGAGVDIDGFYTSLFRSLQSCLAHPLNLPAASITGPLPADLLPPEVLLDAEKLLRRCHEVRYGKLRPDGAEASGDLQALQRIISFYSTHR